jgi:uncharacterized protein YndB with AHSA1/START domain
VPLAPQAVFDLLARPRYYPLWWHGGFTDCPEADPGEPAVGKRATLVVRGFLPYRLTMTTEAVALERPVRIVADASGELVGRGEWTLRPDRAGTRAEFDWRVEVTRPLERRLAPALGPLLAANHAWTMRLGRRGMVRHGPAVLAALADPGPPA